MASSTLIHQKAFFCGNILEEYIYERPILKSATSFTRKRINVRKPKERSKSSLGRTKKHIRRLVNANPGMDKFITLTFAENVVDLSTAHYEFKKWKQKMIRQVGKFKYIAVAEFQVRGAVHYHIMADIPFFSAEKLSKIWGNGFIQIQQIRDKNKTGAYLSKYITKDKTDIRYFGRKIFFYSRNNLVKCVQLVNKWAIDAAKALLYPQIKLMKSYKCSSDFRGEITINFYQLC